MKRSLLVAAVLLMFTSAPVVMADHNSPYGAGWANMPNDIHNTRIEDNLSGDAWRDFVRQGNGARTDNRYLDSSTLPSQRTMSGPRNVSAGGSRGGGGGGGGRR